METQSLNNSTHRRSPSPQKSPDFPPQYKQPVILNESQLCSMMKHWEEYRVKGLKIPRRSYHSSSFHGDSLYVYGGHELNTGMLSDFVRVNLGKDQPTLGWENVPVASKVKPGPRCRHSTVVYQDKLYLYGGQINSVENTNELFTFDFVKGEWQKVQHNPHSSFPSIDSHCALLWEQEGRTTSMIIVGGFVSGKEGGYSNAVYEYDFTENKMATLFKNKEVDPDDDQPLTIPQGRMSLGAAIHKNNLYVFGGMHGHTKFNDLWRFDLIEKKWSPVKVEGDTIPEKRNGHTLVCYKNILVLFGGILDITHEKNDIFVFNLQKNTWTSVEKDTKWIFEDTKKKMNNNNTFFPKGVDSSFSSEAQPGRKRADSKALKSPDRSVNHSPSLGPKPSQMSPLKDLKFQKVKLLDSPTGRVFNPKNNRSSIDESPGKQKASQFQTSLEEKAMRERQHKKMMMLKEFEVNNEERESLRMIAPDLEAMQKSIESLGLVNSKQKESSYEAFDSIGGFDSVVIPAEKKSSDESFTKVGVKPLARDGHSVAVHGGKMFVFAGDRHKMSFNDLFGLNLEFFDRMNL